MRYLIGSRRSIAERSGGLSFACSSEAEHPFAIPPSSTLHSQGSPLFPGSHPRVLAPTRRPQRPRDRFTVSEVLDANGVAVGSPAARPVVATVTP